MPTFRETNLAVLRALLSASPSTVPAGRGALEHVPADGLLILRDGESG